MNELVPRKTLVKYGALGLGGVAGGVTLLALNAIAGVPALIVGGAIAVAGLVLSRSKDDRLPGLITLGAGALVALKAAPLFGGLAGALIGVSGIGLLAMGVINAFKFLRGLRARR